MPIPQLPNSNAFLHFKGYRMRLNNNWIKVGALVAALGVVLGAFAAHGLDGMLTEKYAGQTKDCSRRKNLDRLQIFRRL